MHSILNRFWLAKAGNLKDNVTKSRAALYDVNNAITENAANVARDVSEALARGGASRVSTATLAPGRSQNETKHAENTQPQTNHRLTPLTSSLLPLLAVMMQGWKEQRGTTDARPKKERALQR
jgi:hypothetical protein